jgi:hypothetical protein
MGWGVKKSIRNSTCFLMIMLLSGCGTVHYEENMNMTPIQWVRYLADKHSGWPTSFVVANNNERQGISGTIRSSRGTLSFKNSMDEYCVALGGKNYESPEGKYSCYNAKGPTYFYGLRGAELSQGPTFSVNLIGLVRSSDRSKWEFFKYAKSVGAVFPPESIIEYGSAEKQNYLDNQKRNESIKSAQILRSLQYEQNKKQGSKFKYVGAEVCQDLENGIRLVGTVEQVEGDKIKVFIQQAYIGSPEFVPGGFVQRHDWLNSWEVKSCN